MAAALRAMGSRTNVREAAKCGLVAGAVAGAVPPTGGDGGADDKRLTGPWLLGGFDTADCDLVRSAVEE